jgi:photosystem II stability/assembly factor-like uncharacterized protein
MRDFTICIGTSSGGLWTSSDGGQAWNLANLEIYSAELTVRALAASRHNPAIIWAGSEGLEPGDVLHRSEDRGQSFKIVDAPVNGRLITCITTKPDDSNIVFVGTRPAGVIASSDGGEMWRELPIPVPSDCRIGKPRVTSIAFGPADDEVWVGVEIGGLYQSVDLGASWRKVGLFGGESLLGPGEVWKVDRHEDIHDVAIGCESNGAPAVDVALPIGFFRTTDAGLSWFKSRYPADLGFEDALFYTRTITPRIDDPAKLFVGLGRRPPDHGTLGGIVRSRDGGDTWWPASPVLNSTVWSMDTHPTRPEVMAAATLYGQVLVLLDGETWMLCDREFGEIRTVAVTDRGARL